MRIVAGVFPRLTVSPRVSRGNLLARLHRQDLHVIKLYFSIPEAWGPAAIFLRSSAYI